MELVKQYLKNTYKLSSYQAAQIFFLLKTIFSEASKLFLMGILFHNQLPLYLFALFIMIFLRSFMGGLHFYTYLNCLMVSALYLWLAIYILPHIPITIYFQISLLLLSILICNHIGPILSKYRPESCKRHFTQCKKCATIFIFLYALTLYIMPENNPYLYVGFWVIILHSLQLVIAKIQKKGGESVR